MADCVIPERVKIGPYTFTVEKVDRLENADRGALNGWIQYNTCKILLEASVDFQVQRTTFVHELTHGIANVAGVEMEEEEVERFANVLSSVLIDNPGLFYTWRQY